MSDVTTTLESSQKSAGRSTPATLAVVFVLLGTVAGVLARESDYPMVIAAARTSMMTFGILALLALIAAMTRGRSL